MKLTRQQPHGIAGIIVGAIILCLLDTAAFAQSVPTITSPQNNTVIHQGDSLSVTVLVPSNLNPLSVVIGFGDPGFGILPPLTSSPYNWTANVQTSTFGPKELKAFVNTGAKQGVISSPITLDAEPSSPPVSLTVSPGGIRFFFVGETRPLDVSGTFSDGSTGDLTLSTNIKYISSNSSVATISGAGAVIAQSAGTASILVSYNGSNQQTVLVSVPNSIRGDLNGDGQVDVDDLNILDSALNTPANGPNDARDLNHDGVINALDARILTTLCTYARCATHQ